MEYLKINETEVIDRYLSSKNKMYYVPCFGVRNCVTVLYTEQFITKNFIIQINPQ